jgi:RimJ/RimL family protein N-acetyltransferase
MNLQNEKSEFFLRSIERDDLNKIQTWRNDKNTLPNVREYRIMSKEHINKWYDSMILNDKFEMFIMDSKSADMVGVCGLTYIDWKNSHADLHFAIYKNSQWIDEKYSDIYYPMITKYAFEHLNLNKIYVEIYENDKKKLDFFSKKGFKKDATLREHYFYGGRYWSSYIFSLLGHETEC